MTAVDKNYFCITGLGAKFGVDFTFNSSFLGSADSTVKMIMTCYGFEDSNNIFDVSVNGKIAQKDCLIMGGDDTDPTILEVDIKATVKDRKNKFQVDILDGEIGLCFIKLELVLKNCMAVPAEKLEDAELNHLIEDKQLLMNDKILLDDDA